MQIETLMKNINSLARFRFNFRKFLNAHVNKFLVLLTFINTIIYNLSI